MNENSLGNWKTIVDRPVNGCSLGRIDQYELIRELGGGGFWTSLDRAGSHGYYWSSVPDMDYYKKVSGCLGFGSSDRRTYNVVRYYGQTVRPVQAFTK